ncbi:MAG: hypothetical protein RQ751_00845 [Longimicrobiales bacterium]|nr:hypothetical protein [Longimicrobiales bacterium]
MFLLHAHSGLRYLILLLGLAVVVYALRGALNRAPYDNRMRVMAGVFALLMYLNVFVGLAALFGRPFQPYLIGHVLVMVFAAVTAHLVPAVMKRRPMEERTYLPHAVGAVVALALTVAGILALPAGRVLGSYL